MILSGLAGKIRRFVRGNSRLIDKGNNVAAHIPLRLRIHDQPILNFGRGDMSAITLNVGRLSSLCIITFLCPRSQETEHGKKKQCHQHARISYPEGSHKRFAFTQTFCPDLKPVLVSWVQKLFHGREEKQSKWVQLLYGRMIRNPSYVHTGW